MFYYLNKLLLKSGTKIFILSALGLTAGLSFISYDKTDPSFDYSTDKVPDNFLGYFGSYFSDLSFQFFGGGVVIIPIFFLLGAFEIYKKSFISNLPLKIANAILAFLSLSVILAESEPDPSRTYFGGLLGTYLKSLLSSAGEYFDFIPYFTGAASIFFLFSIFSLFKLLGKILKINFPAPSLLIPLPNFKIKAKKEEIPIKIRPSAVNYEIPLKKTSSEIPAYKNSEPKNREIGLPPIDLLKPQDPQKIKACGKAELEGKGKDLLKALSDFGVKGEIIDIGQGPVVTLYEFEPAAGVKSSRVIGLSDDVARSLSALSTRISVIPGRNVLGIELPNKQRSFFSLRELIETSEYSNPDISLPLILGKDLSGRPLVADLAKMPHLLVAGTTGSGKSVAINAMIISLLYRYGPEECKLILIDPKMLELSVYEDVPHLLTPVVTEPAKAVVALKWAVREMENRYRVMSHLGVRNIEGYNSRIEAAAKEGKKLSRNVHTGFDPETGKPIYESLEIKSEKMPFIVVVVDEMADLMIVAGKDIEASVQRLAQMARAAGIHIIMATQRPSVDVITGVIKANFPSRVSFRVTSKIDSRTILGEQGAERLLGKGDMLYMGGDGTIKRVHGPFVDDSEVQKIADYLRSRGKPVYSYEITKPVDENSDILEDLDSGEDSETLYRRAVKIVKTEKKVSISYVQRCLRIGYNRAADIIERMEKEGVISPPNHTGKREILEKGEE